MQKKNKNNISIASENLNSLNITTKIKTISDKKFRKKPASFYRAKERAELEQKYTILPVKKLTHEEYMAPADLKVHDHIEYEWVLEELKKKQARVKKTFPKKSLLIAKARVLIHQLAFLYPNIRNVDFNFNKIHLFLLKYPNALKIAKDSKDLERYIKEQEDMQEEFNNFIKILGPIIFCKSESLAQYIKDRPWINSKWAKGPERKDRPWALTVVDEEEYKKTILQDWQIFSNKFKDFSNKFFKKTR